METFSQRLADAMEESQHNQSTLARALGTAQSSIGRWLNGSMPRDRALAELASKLGVTVRWLSDGTGDRYKDGAPAMRFREDSNTGHEEDEEARDLYRALEQNTLLGVMAGHISVLRERDNLSEKTIIQLRAGVEELLRRSRGSRQAEGGRR